MTQKFAQNTTYEILTPTGFHHFDGIIKSQKETIKVTFSTGEFLVCTPDHRIAYKSDWILAKSLKPNMKVSNIGIVSITMNGIVDVYDPINVTNGNAYNSGGVISHNCEFLGSSKTLISGSKLSTISTTPPALIKDDLKFYTPPIKDHVYACTVDTSRGQHLDYSAFVIFDITTLPYQVVCTYKCNTISTMAYPFLIMKLCQQYNNAHVLIEINDMGGEVANTLFYEFEYENIYFTYKDELNEGRGYPGVRTTKKVKSIGCAALKDLIEGDQLYIHSHDILSEFSVFVQKGASYAADDETINDDLTMCCVLFSWLTKQAIFAELSNTNIRAIIAKKNEDYISENMLPFAVISNGLEEQSDFSNELDIKKYGSVNEWVFSDLPYED